jgi:hypothetical protein
VLPSVAGSWVAYGPMDPLVSVAVMGCGDLVRAGWVPWAGLLGGRDPAG